MIIGIGVDLVSIPRFERLLSLYGHRIVKRLFHPNEIQAKPLLNEKHAQYYASRWAVKEATIKALGKSGIGSKQIYIEKRSDSPVPLLVLEGEALQQAIKLAGYPSAQKDAIKRHISLSHDHEYAIANVVLEKI